MNIVMVLYLFKTPRGKVADIEDWGWGVGVLRGGRPLSHFDNREFKMISVDLMWLLKQLEYSNFT
jgi:hypothetical protein